jgi:formylglycine-generating enzyme required for sulfatase activity/pimeloyl-ACP methyl ester carboxylesterase
MLTGSILLAVLAATPAPRVVDLKAADGTQLKATYSAAAAPGPGVVLVHQSNRDRRSWEGLAAKLAAAGIHTVTIDVRGHGDSAAGDPKNAGPGAADDVEAALQCLLSQPGVDRNRVGFGGAGWLGVLNSIEVARHHAAQVKSLALLSGETLRAGLDFLRQAPTLPELFVVADNDEYPPTVEAMELLYINASSASKKFVHYATTHEAPWLWYETSDASRVPASGSHGTDLFETHAELQGLIVDWFVDTLIRTPGHAPADTIAAARIINLMQTPGGVVKARDQLLEVRKKDPDAQLWPECTVDIVGEDLMRDGNPKAAIEIFELNALAYPDSADAHTNLADAYRADGRKELARQHAETALALLDAHKTPASSWSDTEPRRGEIRKTAEEVLQRLNAFRDCPECPEMVIVPAGKLMMGSSEAERSWVAAHGGNLQSVADEAPQHEVPIPSFAIGRYDVTRGEYAEFAKETGYPAGDGCGVDSFKWNKKKELSWQRPGFEQSDRDPAVCVSWNDAQAYVTWLNRKLHLTAYRLPGEAEWEYAARAGSTTPFWWGESDADATAHAWFKANSEGRTHPVGAKPANAFGLYDIVGNVWQWTQDCYAGSYAKTPPQTDDCLRVDRGGSWLYPAWLLRSATRERNPGDFRDVIMGFRLAKTLP